MRAYLLWKNPEDACIEVYVVIPPSSPLEILVLFPLSLSLSLSLLSYFFYCARKTSAPIPATATTADAMANTGVPPPIIYERVMESITLERWKRNEYAHVRKQGNERQHVGTNQFDAYTNKSIHHSSPLILYIQGLMYRERVYFFFFFFFMRTRARVCVCVCVCRFHGRRTSSFSASYLANRFFGAAHCGHR